MDVKEAHSQGWISSEKGSSVCEIIKHKIGMYGLMVFGTQRQARSSRGLGCYLKQHYFCTQQGV